VQRDLACDVPDGHEESRDGSLPLAEPKALEPSLRVDGDVAPFAGDVDGDAARSTRKNAKPK
jgi:hypothetical protein